MTTLGLHEFHEALGAHFTEVNGCEVVQDYGDVPGEYSALRETAGVLDLSFRGRLCVTGGDRVRFLNGQVTNNVKDLRAGSGCYAALVTAKGKLQSDLNIWALPDELLLDFEPGLAELVTQRLEKFIIADDAQMVDASIYYGLLSVQGPKAEAVLRGLGLTMEIPQSPFASVTVKEPTLGDIYMMNRPRTGASGFDLFVPVGAMPAVMDKLAASAKGNGGRACGWQALEIVRIEAGIPRFGVDMDESNLASESLDERAISYSKGCYIGQEVIARIRTYSQAPKSLRGFRLADDLKQLPAKRNKLFHDGKEAGYITSAVASPALKVNIALGYVRKEVNLTEAKLILKTAAGESMVRMAELPFG